jgi:RNA polymerase sigma factor (sigma-70 family)
MEASALPVDTGILRAPGAPVLLRLRSDEQLVALFRAGNEEAFGVICDRFQTRLLAYVRRMLPPGPRANAEDVLQDVYMRAYSALRADDRPLAVRAWLYRVAHNRCIDELRRPGAQPTEIVEQEGDPRLDPALAAERREHLRRLVVDLGRLPEQQRSALLMRELEGFTYEELGATLGVTQPAVKSLLVRARVGLAEAAQARDASCDDIREDLAETRDRRVRTSARAKRHLRDCGDCRGFDKALRSTSRDLGLLLPAPAGLFAMLAGLLGGGAGAGGGAAGIAGGSGAAGVAGGGIAAATAAKVAVVVCCVAATAGGAAAVKVEHALKHPAPVAASSSAATSTSRPAAPVQTLPAQAPAVPVSDPVATPGQPAAADGTTTVPASDSTGVSGATDPATADETTGGLPSAGGSASPDEPAETTAEVVAETTTQTVPAAGPAVTTETSTTAAPVGTSATTTQPAATATTATVAPAS